MANTTPTGSFCAQFGLDDGEWDGNPGFVFSPTTVYNYQTYQFELIPSLWYYNRTELEWLKVTSAVVSTPTSITTYGPRGATYYYYYP